MARVVRAAAAHARRRRGRRRACGCAASLRDDVVTDVVVYGTTLVRPMLVARYVKTRREDVVVDAVPGDPEGWFRKAIRVRATRFMSSSGSTDRRRS